METVIRVALVYVFLMVGLRFMGKREFSQLSPLELVTLLLVPEIFSQGILREDFSLTNGFVAIGTLFTLVFLSSALQFHSPRFARLLFSTPTVLVEHGRLIPPHLNKERIAPDEIYGEMHKSGLERIEQVKWAILETDGKISIIPFQQPGQPQKKPKNQEVN
jgi:uncharacterized membrane protein YcaP (DUF421 family)